MIVHSIDELDKVVGDLINFADECRTLLFYGEIGAGKTTLIQRFCSYFEVDERVTSPTFSLVNEYTFNDNHQPVSGIMTHKNYTNNQIGTYNFEYEY